MLPEVCNFGILFCSFVLTQKNQKVKAAKKKAAFGLNFNLHQCQVRRGDLLVSTSELPRLTKHCF
jgi:hypothetical protein